jgi:hypothetical protein
MAGLLLSCLLGICAAPVAAQVSTDEADSAQTANPPRFLVRVFGDTQWWVTEGPDSLNSFALGQFDLFLTAPLSERISVLTEIVLEASRGTLVVTDLERLLVTFRMNDYLHISAGRFHSGIGFYNTTFHHGAFFETAIERPRIFAFEDEGGVLPVHETGVTVSGTIPRTGEALHYLFEVGNGRDWLRAEDGLEAKTDTNAAKSTNVRLSYRPERWRGVEIGASLFRDDIPLAPSQPTVAHRVGTVFAAYKTPSTEILAEWVHLYHRSGASPGVANDAGYLQASRAFRIWRPFYRYDRYAFDARTPLIGERGSYTAHTVGLRIDPLERLGFKAQFEWADSSVLRGANAFRTQMVFVF